MSTEEIAIDPNLDTNNPPAESGEEPGASFDLDDIVSQAQSIMARHANLTLTGDDADDVDDGDDGDGDDPTAETGADDDAGDATSASGPPVDDPSPDPGTDPRPLASGEGEGSPDDPDPDPPAATTPDDGWDRVGKAWEQLHGTRPTYDDLEQLAIKSSHYDTLIGQLTSLPPDQQQIVAAMAEGTFDPAAYAQQVLAANRSTSADPFSLDDDGQPDPTVAAIQQLRGDIQSQQQREQAAAQQQQLHRVNAELDQLYADLQAANPHLTEREFGRIGHAVNQSGQWERDYASTGSAYNAYLKHLSAHAVANGLTLNPPSATATTPPPATTTPATPDATSPPTEPPGVELDAAQLAHAQRAQAAATALSGSSTPRRRSIMDKSPGAAQGEKRQVRNVRDLTADIQAAAEEMLNGRE